MKQSFVTAALIIALLALVKCTSVPKEKTGKELAQVYCSSCHLFPEPSLLDKQTWHNNVLPAMASKLGIGYYNDMPYQLASSNKNDSLISSSFTISDWNKIVKYYDSLAPQHLSYQNRKKITDTTDLFTAHYIYTKSALPLTSYVKIDAGNHLLYTADAFDSALHTYALSGKPLNRYTLGAITTDINFNEDILKSGRRSGLITNIGILQPNDTKTGSLKSFAFQNHNIKLGNVADSIRRPVSTTACDLNKDGKTDFVVCGFGNTTGEFFYLLQQPDSSFLKHLLWAMPGAIKSYVRDVNKDGLPDIIALFAQAEEGIYLFTNKGNNVFERSRLLAFPSVYGSSYFELADMNNDGLEDIIYTCGDNADYSSNELKFYHGVYIFEQQKNGSYKQVYFFAQHGSYKAMAADIDNDGDNDLIAISFFADYKQQPQEALVYLENTGNLHFIPHSIPCFNKGHWLTLDVADADGDGDNDILAGSFNPPADNKNKSNISAIFFENRTKK